MEEELAELLKKINLTKYSDLFTSKDGTPQMRYEISSAIFQERETAASIAFTSC